MIVRFGPLSKPAAILLALAALAPPATAQETPAAAPPAAAPPAAAPAPAAAAPEKPLEEEVVVTGSRVRRKDLNTPAPVAIVSREQIQQSGKLTIGDFLQTLPEQGNAPNFQLNNGGATYGADGSTRVNLRSLGVVRTLVLVNGRRFVSSGVGASPSVDLNTIPTAAVERIEVLKDGASAVYGSDAVAGVVNVITRNSFNGTEAGATYGTSSRGDAETFDGHVTMGRSNASGNFVFSVGYFNQQKSWLRDRNWSKDALTYDYNAGQAVPGGSFRTPQGTIALPANPDGSATAECLANPLCSALAQTPQFSEQAFIRVLGQPVNSPSGWRVMGNADTYNFARDNYLTIPSQRVQIWSAGDTKFEQVRAFYEASYVQQATQQNAAPMPLNPGDYTTPNPDPTKDPIPITLSSQSIYNPFGVDLPFAGRRLVEFGPRLYKQDLATFRVVTGVDGTLPSGFGPLSGWSWETAINYGRTTGTLTTEGAIRNSRIAAALGPSFLIGGNPVCGNPGPDGLPGTADDQVVIGCTPINLFGGPGTIDPAQKANLGFTGTSRAFDSMLSLGTNATGDLFTLVPGNERPVSLAVGYEYRHQSGAQIADPIAASGDSADFNFGSTDGSYDVHEAYAELSIPIVSNAEWVKNLEASLAGRFVNYNTFGNNFTYKLGARYSPIDDVTLRGTYSTAFRAPSINELFLGASESAPAAQDPCGALSSATQAIKDQCAATGVGAGGSGDGSGQVLTRSAGDTKLKPEKAKTFTAGIVVQPQAIRGLSVTLDYYDIVVDDVIGNLGTPAILAACYPGAGGTQALCDLVTRSATTGRILFVSDNKRNLGQLHTSGIDFSARYGIPSTVGKIGLSFDGTWLGRFDNGGLHGRGNYDLAGRGFGGALPIWKFNVGANWANAGWSAATMARYIGSFKECGASDGTSAGGLCFARDAVGSRQVGSNLTVDLNGGYQFSSGFGKTAVLVGVSNVFDKAPQYVYSAVLANSDPSTYDFVGRFFYTRVVQTF